MKLERISLPVHGAGMRAVDLHAGLTVVEAAPGDEAALVRALVGSLGTAEDGVHVEFTQPDGSFLVAFRPTGAAHRVVDVVTHGDATGRYVRQDGGVDLLAAWRSTGRVLERDLVAGAEDLQQGDATEQWVAKLSEAEVSTLMAAAAADVAAEEELQRVTDAARAVPDQSAAARQLNEAHERADIAERRHNRIRVAVLAVGTTVPASALIGLNTVGTAGAIGLLSGTLAVTAGCIVYERRLAQAIEAENAAVERLRGGASASSSADDLGPLPDAAAADESVRAALLAAAERYQTTAQAWHDLAGAVPAPWVLAQSERLRKAAALRAQVAAPTSTDDSLTPGPPSAALMAGLIDRVASNRTITGDDNPLPLFLEDPLSSLQWSDKATVLEFLGRLAQHQQIVLVTSDEEVLAWARLEAMTGAVGAATMAPGPEGDPSEQHSAMGAPGEGRSEPGPDGS